jgi:GntR family transcriptional regulator, transcriptional repressor for pyruvate dehydrogenase complex
MTETQPTRLSRRTRAPARPEDAPSEFMLVPSNRQRLGDQLYGQILDHIVSGRLKEGDRLPPEKEICELFGVSRPTVREALLRLRADGLIQARQGAGTFVINRPAERLTNFTSSADVAGYLRCVEVRLPLEGVAARLAAERRTPEQLKKIEAAHEDFARAIKSGQFGADEDLAFHALIAEATGNEFFSHILKNINHALIGFMRLTLNLTRTGSKERASKVVDEHRRIVEAIRAQDGEEAANAMQFHIGQARRRLTDRNRDR